MLALNRQALAQALKLPTASRPYWSQITDAGQWQLSTAQLTEPCLLSKMYSSSPEDTLSLRSSEASEILHCSNSLVSQAI
jgi:hypothetical protein